MNSNDETSESHSNDESTDPTNAEIADSKNLSDIDEAAVTSSSESEASTEEPKPVPNLMLMGIIVEGGMVVLAIVIGWFGFCDNQQSLLDFDSETVLQPAFIWGVTSTIPLLALLLCILKTDFGLMKTMRKTVDELLGPMFKNCTVLDVAILSLMAGIGEEIFFRWCLQGGLAEAIGLPNGPLMAAIIIGIFFGLCHFVNLNYAIITTGIGIYLGLVMNWSGTYLAPAFSHAFFDFVALMVVVRRSNHEEISGYPE